MFSSSLHVPIDGGFGLFLNTLPNSSLALPCSQWQASARHTLEKLLQGYTKKLA